MSKRRVVAISGKMQHGKTTLATMIQAHLENRGRTAVLHGFAVELKKDLVSLGIDVHDKSEPNRKLMQAYGQAQRAKDPDYWVKRWAAGANDYGVVIVDDMRFQNEFLYMRDEEDALLIRVEKRALPAVGLVHMDQSETDLDDFDRHGMFYKRVIADPGDLAPLQVAAEAIVAQMYPQGKIERIVF